MSRYYETTQVVGQRRCSPHWGCRKLLAVVWFARVAMNLIAWVARLWWHVYLIRAVVLVVALALVTHKWA